MAELILYLKDREMGRHQVRTQAVRVGRDPSNELVIDNVGISRHHATVWFNGQQFIVQDAGSQNGVFVNGQRIREFVIGPGDSFQLGKFTVRLMHDQYEDLSQLVPAQAVVEAAPSARDPMRTMALGAEDVAKLMAEHASATPPANQSRATAAQPVTTRPQTSSGDSEKSLLLLLVGILTIALIGVVVYVVVVR